MIGEIHSILQSLFHQEGKFGASSVCSKLKIPETYNGTKFNLIQTNERPTGNFSKFGEFVINRHCTIEFFVVDNGVFYEILIRFEQAFAMDDEIKTAGCRIMVSASDIATRVSFDESDFKKYYLDRGLNEIESEIKRQRGQ